MIVTAGRTYEGKTPRNSGGLVNDRQVVWMGIDSVQYDSPTVKWGQKLPTVSKEKFAKWVGADVTEQMPKGEWRQFDSLKPQ
jgi:hypothetical protein